MPPRCTPIFLSALLCAVTSQATAQDVSVAPSETVQEVNLQATVGAVSPVVWRGTLKNVLTDPMARLPFGASITLRAPIAVHFPSEKAAFCWDAKTCRLTAAWSGDFLKIDPATSISEPAGELRYLAAGPPPFSAAVGAYGKPKYFGFKLNNRVPTFYYSVGRLGVQETITFSEDGSTMKQLFKIENAPGEVVLVLPEAWKDRIASKKGKMNGRFLTLTSGEAAEFSLTYSLVNPAPVAAESAAGTDVPTPSDED